MHRRFDRRAFFRHTLYAALLLVLHTLQNTGGLFPTPYATHAWLLIPAVVCVGMCERERAGLFYGLLAGLLWDSLLLGSNYYTIFLCLAGYLCGSLTRRLMRNNIMTACLLSAAFLLLFTFGRWLLAIGFQLGTHTLRMLLQFYLPSCLYSFLLSPPTYWLVRKISNSFAAVYMQDTEGTL